MTGYWLCRMLTFSSSVLESAVLESADRPEERRPSRRAPSWRAPTILESAVLESAGWRHPGRGSGLYRRHPGHRLRSRSGGPGRGNLIDRLRCSRTRGWRS